MLETSLFYCLGPLSWKYFRIHSGITVFLYITFTFLRLDTLTGVDTTIPKCWTRALYRYLGSPCCYRTELMLFMIRVGEKNQTTHNWGRLTTTPLDNENVTKLGSPKIAFTLIANWRPVLGSEDLVHVGPHNNQKGLRDTPLTFEGSLERGKVAGTARRMWASKVV